MEKEPKKKITTKTIKSSGVKEEKVTKSVKKDDVKEEKAIKAVKKADIKEEPVKVVKKAEIKEEETAKVVKKASAKKAVKKASEKKTNESTAKVGRPKGEIRLEKEFHGTKTGKFARVILIVACIVMVVGTLAQIIIGFVYKDADNIKQVLQSISEATDYGFVLTLLYFVLYEAFKSENK